MPSPLFRPRVLLIAAQCNPEWVSVPLVGWSHSQALRRVADVTLVTQWFNRPGLSGAGLREGEDFVAMEPSRSEALIDRLSTLLRGGRSVGWTIATAAGSLTHYGLERRIWRKFGQGILRGDFDVIHRLTPLSPTATSPIAPLCRRAGVPFVVGPLNGGLPWPPGFRQARRGEREWLMPFRALHRFVPGYHATRRDASAIVVGSRATRAELGAPYAERCVYIPENGVDPQRFTRAVEGEAQRPVKVVFVGRHVRYKGADLLVEAAAPLLRDGAVRLEMVGEGPETPRLRAAVAAEGLAGAVDFPGWIPHAALQERLVRADVLGFPSLREFGGAVVVEAMALGLVPLVLDYGGPGELVSPSTGFAIPMGSRQQVIERLRAALRRLAGEPSLIRPIGRRARERALTLFTWDAKARQMLEVYRWVSGRSTTRPDFGMPFADPGDDRATAQ